MARVMAAQPLSPSSDTERIYACQHCPKRYARKDYLERHELNHTRPGSVCPACGKGFARPDVLRKHLSTSCKSRRGSDGDAPAPLTTAEEDALVPRKRRRPQRRITAGTSESLSPSSSDEAGPSRRPPPPRLSHSYDESYDYPAAPNSASSTSTTGTARFPGRRDLDAHARYAPSLRLQQQMPQLSPTRFEPPSDPSPDGPARIGASLEIPLAPAYAATPEALDPLSFPSKEGDWHVAATTASAHAAAAKLDLPVYPLLPISSTIETPVADVAGLPPVVGNELPVSPVVNTALVNNMNNPWNPTTETTNNNMDDLFSWLFSMANTTGTFTTAQAPIALDVNAMLKPSEQAAFELKNRNDNGLAHKAKATLWPITTTTATNQLPPFSPTSDASSSCILNALNGKRSRNVYEPEGSLSTRKRPHLEPSTSPGVPLLVAHDDSTSPVSNAPISPITPTGPLPQTVLDEQAREHILSLIESSVRDDPTSQALVTEQMKLYFELYFSM